ncbi:hypothetical protein UlMin_044544 [Ulmus minor]
MGLKLENATISLLVLFALAVTAHSANFDISKYGAKSNGDVAQALTKAWQAACASTIPSKVVVPRGIWKLSRVTFFGPCKAPIQFQLQGTLQAPSSANGFKDGDGWVTFERIDRLTLFGAGVFDGQGKTTYGKHCDRLKYCSKLPINVRFNFITNSVIRGVTTQDSKQFHIMVLSNNNVTFEKIRVIAPEDSYNTDGFHLGRSTKIRIVDSIIQTGDDCISIGDGNKDIRIDRITCGPGHGISIGSLGRYKNESPVEGVYVTNSIFKRTSNGVRIKTFAGSSAYAGAASDLHFCDLIMYDVNNPILVDQEYCPWGQCNLDIASKVKLSKISFKNIRGTSTSALAVNLVCSAIHGCKGLEMGNIDLKYQGPDGKIACECKNVKPIVTGKMYPPACNAKPGTTPAPDRAYQMAKHKVLNEAKSKKVH